MRKSTPKTVLYNTFGGAKIELPWTVMSSFRSRSFNTSPMVLGVFVCSTLACSRTELLIGDASLVSDVPSVIGDRPTMQDAVELDIFPSRPDVPIVVRCQNNEQCADRDPCTLDECNFADGMCTHRLDDRRCECDPQCHVVVTGMGGRPFTAEGRTDVELDELVNGLVVRANLRTSDHFWIPNTAESTVSKWDAVAEREVGRYRVGLPSGECRGQCCYAGPCNQVSRVAVDGLGNAFAASRGFSMQGSVAKIAAARRDCVDRNMNGTIETSTGPLDVLPYGADECVVWNRDVGAIDNVLRSVAIDRGDEQFPEGYVWVGSCRDLASLRGNAGLYRLNPQTGVTLEHLDFAACGYGAVVTRDGTLWEHTLGQGITPVNPRTNVVGQFLPTNEGRGSSYGITADADGRIWLSSPGHGAYGYDPDLRRWSRVELESIFVDRAATGLGITVDHRNHVWVASARAAFEWDARSFRADAAIDLAQVRRHTWPEIAGFGLLSAIGADRRGRIWLASWRTGPLVKLDPETDEVTAFPGHNEVYTYTDFTGGVRRLVIGTGSYTDFYDTDCDPLYDSFEWSGDFPPGTSVQFVLRTATTEAGLSAGTPVAIAVAPRDVAPVDVAARLLAAGVVPGRFARITATLLTTTQPLQTPVLRSMRFSWRCR